MHRQQLSESHISDNYEENNATPIGAMRWYGGDFPLRNCVSHSPKCSTPSNIVIFSEKKVQI